MQVLYVHGMSRSPLSGWPMLYRLRRAGWHTEVFGYSTALRSFAEIEARLRVRIERLAAQGEYVLVCHSLGGTLTRGALAGLPSGVRAPAHVFLLGSPVQPSRLAQKLRQHPVYRLLTGDCGQLLGDAKRMAAIPPVRTPCTAIVGTRGFPYTRRYFRGEANDGVVGASETAADWLVEPVVLPIMHTWMPGSGRVTEVVRQRAVPQAGAARVRAA